MGYDKIYHVPPFIRTVIDLLLPPPEDVTVARLISEHALASSFHPRLAREAWIVALFRYSDPAVRAMIRAAKFYNETAPIQSAMRLASDYIVDAIGDKKRLSGWRTPLLIPMPLSKKRLYERGYNQVERFAEALMTYLEGSVAYAPKALAREDRESQVRMKREDRADNIEGAFFAPVPDLVRGRHVILLDDVVESGATLKDARRALSAAGVLDVLGIGIAH